jgi:hypothetical protein
MTPTQPNTVLNLMTPTALPDPTGLVAALAAVQNGNMFRDATGQATLGQTLANLSSLAARTAEVAGQLSGDAAAKALDSANSLGQQVMQATKTVADSGNSGGGVTGLIAQTLSGMGGAIGEVMKLYKDRPKLSDITGDLPSASDAARKAAEALDVRHILGLPTRPSSSGNSNDETTSPPPTSSAPALDLRQLIIDVAEAEKNRIPKVDDTDAIGKDRIYDYWAWYYEGGSRESVDEAIAASDDPVATRRTMFDKWCNVFAVHCWLTAGATIIPKEFDQDDNVKGCERLMKWFQENGRWLSPNQTPQKGDMVLYDNKTSKAGHVGLVISVVDGTFSTIEGNAPHTIEHFPTRHLTGNGGNGNILGFGSVVPLSEL